MSVEIVLVYLDGLQLPNIVSMIDERIKEAKVRDEVMGDIRAHLVSYQVQEHSLGGYGRNSQAGGDVV